MSAAEGNNVGLSSPERIGSDSPVTEDDQEETGFLSLVKGNNLTLNDYILMMNNGLYNDFGEEDDNDPDIDEYRAAQKRDLSGNSDTSLSDADSADQYMNKEEQENLF